MNGNEVREGFLENGYVVVRGCLDEETVGNVKYHSDRLLDNLDDSHRKKFPYQGSMVPASLSQEPWQEIVSNKSIIATLRHLGAQDLKWLSGYLISKPPHSPRLWWHQDWWAWDSELTYQEMPAQISVTIYPTGTSEQSGCLRVIPGSHRHRHALHDILPPAHTDAVNELPIDHPAFAKQSDEVSIPLSPYDFIVCDARLLHATFENTSATERPGIVLWYLPDFSSLPRRFQYHYSQNQCQPGGRDRQAFKHLSHLIIPGLPKHAASPIVLERTPGNSFQ